MATETERLILRGLHLSLRATFSPNDPQKQAAHFVKLQQDIGPWLTDYAAEMSKEVEYEVVDFKREAGDAGGAGGIQQ